MNPKRAFDNPSPVTSAETLHSPIDGFRELPCPDGGGSAVLVPFAIIKTGFMHFEEDDIPLISGTGEAFMDVPVTPAAGSRRDEDIALDLMKFIAMTTGYGKTTTAGGGVGFEKSGGGSAKPEEYASHLLDLYGKCLSRVSKK